MYLKRLEIIGFKSFARRSILEFPKPKKGNLSIAAIVGPNGVGKCVHGSTKIALADGKIETIQNIVEKAIQSSPKKEYLNDGFCVKENPENLQVLSLNPQTLKLEKKPIYAFIKRKAPSFLLRIKTRAGREIITTHYHPFFSIKDGGVINLKANQLNKGVYIALPRILNINTQKIFFSQEKLLANFITRDNVYAPYSPALAKFISCLRTEYGSLKNLILTANTSYNGIYSIRNSQALNIAHLYPILKLNQFKDYTIKKIKSKGRGRCKLPLQLDSNLARFLGYIISEGRVTYSNHVRFVNNDPGLVKDFCKAAKETFNLTPHVFNYKERSKDVIIFSSVLCHFLERFFDLKINETSSQKSVPKQIFQAPIKIIREFVSALFEGDAYVCARKKATYIEYTTASKTLADGLVTLLLRLGIYPLLREKQKYASNTKNKTKRTYYSVYIFGIKNLKNLSNQLRFVGEKKKVLERIKRLKMSSNPNIDIVPNVNKIIKDVIRLSTIKVKPLRKKCSKLSAYNENRCYASRDGIKEIIKVIQKFGKKNQSVKNLLKQLEILSNSDIFWDEIISVEKIKAEKWVYDLSIPKTHNFIANNFVVHNSNLVESIRWALGEQSLKSLRGKKLQDIIFSGSVKKTRLNLAEVTLFFNNEDGAAPIDYKEFTVTRRIYRNGESEYLINKNKIRLQDILILLAKSNFGQKSYSVVSQGMVDQILQSSPLERKKFFDEATGIKQYQIKKDEAIRKIDRSQINLQQANIALSEISPHLRSLNRQINKLERRKEIEAKLIKLQNKYYGVLWQDSSEKIFLLNKKINQEIQKQKQVEEILENVQKQSEALVYEKIDDQYEKIQKDYQRTLEEKNKYLGEQSILQAQLNFQKQLNQRNEEKLEIELDEKKLLLDLKNLKSDQKEFLNKIEKISQIKELEKIKKLAKTIYEKIILCLKQFEPGRNTKTTSTNSEQEQLIKTLEENKEQIDRNIKEVDKKLERINQELNEFNEEERGKRKKLLDWQKNIQEKQSKLNQFTYKINELKIEMARLETKKDVLEEEINEEMGAQGKEIMKIRKTDIKIKPEQEDLDEIHKLKHQMELIGSIDPEITKEYPEVSQRYEFLNSQSDDLTKSLKTLNKIIQELDEKIKEQFKKNFSQINQMFDRYFKIIFGGGHAKIILQKQEQEPQKNEDEQESLIMNRIIDGIDIFATPPGKKIKSIEMLSGGEKALASLALICAIISINKPPFVVLDEVDAALDQENSFRFGKILQELRHNSQFIIITHNQQTIEAADILYGITMDSDSISRLISLKLEE